MCHSLSQFATVLFLNSFRPFKAKKFSIYLCILAFFFNSNDETAAAIGLHTGISHLKYPIYR